MRKARTIEGLEDEVRALERERDRLARKCNELKMALILADLDEQEPSAKMTQGDMEQMRRER